MKDLERGKMKDLKQQYRERYEKILKPLEPKLKNYLNDNLLDMKRICDIVVRVKSIKRVIEKSLWL